eukprot:11196681-Prorocentrum_lima.AAC.1
MYPARSPPPVVDLTQQPDDEEDEGDDAPVDRPEDPPELDEPDDMQSIINAGKSVPTANQEVCTGAASSAAAPATPLPRPPLSTIPAVAKPLPP